MWILSTFSEFPQLNVNVHEAVELAFSEFSVHKNHLEGLCKQIFNPSLNSVHLGWRLTLCISIKFPGDVDVASVGGTLGDADVMVKEDHSEGWWSHVMRGA